MRCVYLLLQKSLDSRRVHLLSHPATNLLSHPANLLSHPATNLPSHPATNLLTLTLSLLPRNRGTALGIVQSEVQEMQLLLKTLRILLLLEMILLPTSTLVQLSDFYFIASSFRLSDFYSIASSFWSMIAGNQD
jgi:hypothetical protein